MKKQVPLYSEDIIKKDDQPIEASKKVTVQNNSQEEKSFKLEVEYHGERKGIQDAVK